MGPDDLQKSVRLLLEQYPELRDVLEAKGIRCNECFIAERETLAGVASMHHLDLDELLRDWEQRRLHSTAG